MGKGKEKKREKEDKREWLSWWSATLPRSRPRVRVPSRAFVNRTETLMFTAFPLFLCIYNPVDSCRQYFSTVTMPLL